MHISPPGPVIIEQLGTEANAEQSTLGAPAPVGMPAGAPLAPVGADGGISVGILVGMLVGADGMGILAGIPEGIETAGITLERSGMPMFMLLVLNVPMSTLVFGISIAGALKFGISRERGATSSAPIVDRLKSILPESIVISSKFFAVLLPSPREGRLIFFDFR